MLNRDKVMILTEWKRKGIHLGSSLIPLGYFYLLSREQILYFTCFITVGFLVAEFARFKVSFYNALFRKIFFSLLREDEKKKDLTGATYLFLAMCITIYLFEKEIAVPAMLILAIADSFAAIIGKMIGRHKFFLKSIEGSITFFLVSAVLLYIFIPQKGVVILLIALLVTIIEVLPVAINDNLVIPLSAGFFLMVF
jgi:dolichol kinase